MGDEDKCKGEKNEVDHLGVRIGAIFVVLVTSAIFTLFPIVAKRIPKLRIPHWIYEFAKYFGSGVIIATAFVHLLEPANDELSVECLNYNFNHYPMAYGFALISLMVLFMSEYFAYRLGTRMLQGTELENSQVAHHHAPGHMEAHDSALEHEREENTQVLNAVDKLDDEESLNKDAARSSTVTDSSELVGIFVLEFGIVFHSVIIGLTLSTTSWDGDDRFQVLFPVIVFHQLFEGMGLGSRLAYLPPSLGHWMPYLLAFLYSIVAPVGMAIGLGARHSYTQDTPTGYYVTGIFDSVSAGILIYTGLVELLAHDFIFNDGMRRAPLPKVFLNMVEVCTGAGVMALLGRWA